MDVELLGFIRGLAHGVGLESLEALKPLGLQPNRSPFTEGFFADGAETPNPKVPE